MYGIVAVLSEDSPKRSLPPVGRSGRAQSSLEDGRSEQLEQLQNEAGARRKL